MAQRSQSATEYLMTYGWAIVAVAVALGVLYSLGVFGLGGSSSATGCTVISGFTCSKPVLFSSGILTLGFGQIGATKNISATGCTQNATAPTNWLSTGATFQSGQISNLTFSCQGVQSTGGTLGQIYSGTLWIQYTVSGGNGQTFTQEVGSVKLPFTNNGNPLGAIAYVVGSAGVVSVINTTTETVVNTITIGGTLTGVAFNPSGSLAYVTSYAGTVSVIYTANNVLINTISVPGPCTDLMGIAISPGGTIGYATCDTLAGQLAILNLPANTATSYSLPSLGNDQHNPTGVAFSPDGTYAYVASAGSPTGAIMYVTVATNTVNVGKSMANAQLTAGAHGVAFNPSGTIVYLTSSDGIGYFTIATSTPNLVYPGSMATAIAINPSGSLLYVTTGNANTNNAIPISIPSNVIGANVVMGTGYSEGVAFNPSGSYVYIVNDVASGSVSVVNPQNGNVVATITGLGSQPSAIAFLP
jgi:YVTN family beta-propeller protein